MSFSRQIKRFAKKAGKNMDNVVRMSFIELSTRIVRRSPVGDPTKWKGNAPKGYTGGRFRANWQAGVNRKPSGEVNSTNMASSTASISAAARAKARSYYLMNNLPYATSLENGHSRQAPAGIVKLAVAEWESIVKLTAKLVK